MPVAEKAWPEVAGYSGRCPSGLFSVGYPDIFHLGCVLEEPATFRDATVEPIDDAAFVGPDLFQISAGHSLGGGDGSFISVAPDGVNAIVLGKGFEQLRNVSGNNIDGSARKIAGIKNLVEVARDERILFGWDSDDGIADGE
jgi:hypothetical protein